MYMFDYMQLFKGCNGLGYIHQTVLQEKTSGSMNIIALLDSWLPYPATGHDLTHEYY